MKVSITINGKKEMDLRKRSELEDVDGHKECLFLFDDGGLYHGYTDGAVDDAGLFIIGSKTCKERIAMPFARLIGWAYMDADADGTDADADGTDADADGMDADADGMDADADDAEFVQHFDADV